MHTQVFLSIQCNYSNLYIMLICLHVGTLIVCTVKLVNFADRIFLEWRFNNLFANYRFRESTVLCGFNNIAS